MKPDFSTRVTLFNENFLKVRLVSQLAFVDLSFEISDLKSLRILMIGNAFKKLI